MCPAAVSLTPSGGFALSIRRYDFEMQFTAAVTHEAPWYVVRCLDVDVVSQGANVDEALANLKEALELFFKGQTIPINLEPPIIATVLLSA